jgi:hypothetical protein
VGLAEQIEQFRDCLLNSLLLFDVERLPEGDSIVT